ncbi:unnamed protein product, partial [Ascophyllum nodosum]
REIEARDKRQDTERGDGNTARVSFGWQECDVFCGHDEKRFRPKYYGISALGLIGPISIGCTPAAWNITDLYFTRGIATEPQQHEERQCVDSSGGRVQAPTRMHRST